MNNSNNGNLMTSNLNLSQNTIVRILFDEQNQAISEMEILKVISEAGQTFKLSNGVSLYKGCLMPYHSVKDYHSGEEYFFLRKLII
ncbi:MAG: hypothetical protein ACRCXY_08505 [Fusobacteriaceae bacterium]